MFLKKKRKERIINSIKYFQQNNYNNLTTKNEDLTEENVLTHEDEDYKKNNNIREIPGYYYDYEKERYFPLKNSHMKSFSEFIETKNKIIAKNIEIKNYKKDTIKNKTVELNPDSMFNIITRIKNLKVQEIRNNKNYNKIIYNFKVNNLNVIDLKIKDQNTIYQLSNLTDSFLISYDTSDIDNIFLVEKIENLNGEILRLKKHKVLRIKFRENNFDDFRIFNNEFILIIDRKLIFIDNQALIFDNEKAKGSVKFIDLTYNLRSLKIVPENFRWPIIQQNSNNSQFILLFYKCILFV